MKVWMIGFVVELLPVPLETFKVNDNLVIAHIGDKENISLALICVRTKEKAKKYSAGTYSGGSSNPYIASTLNARNEAASIVAAFLGADLLINQETIRIVRELPPVAVDTDEQLCHNAKELVKEYTTFLDGVSKKEAKRRLRTTTKLFNKILNLVNGQKYLSIAMLMYFRGSSKFMELEGLVNLTTAMEALYSDGSQELRYKIAMRASVFIGGSEHAGKLNLEKVKLFNSLKRIYDLRSKIVHGSDLSISFIDAILLSIIVRRSLDKFLTLAEKGMTRKQILEHIDELALTNKAK